MKSARYLTIALLAISSCTKQASSPGALPSSYANQSLGAAANDLLSGNKFSAINIQIQYMPGYPLDTATLTNLTNYLGSLCNKPGGINITQSQIPASASDTVSVNQAAEIEAQHRSAYNAGSAIAVYVLVTNGYDTSTYVLGFAYRSTSICLFGRDIYENSGGLYQVSRVSLESSVLEHEFGHLMGLVNLGTDMVSGHQDTAHGKHCDNQNCLMYYAIETHETFASLNNNIPALDSNCLNDLKANGGK